MLLRLVTTWCGMYVLVNTLALPGLAAEEVRERIDLNGRWEFRLDPENAGEAGRWYAGAVQFPQTINVPGSWQAQGVGEPSGNLRHHYAGVAWYRRTVAVPGAWRDQVVRLRIGGVHRRAKVFVNGTAIGSHDGFSAPFSFDVTRTVKPGGVNDIVIRVENPHVTIDASPDKQQALLPTGMFNYIGNWGGFYGDVTLESSARTWIGSSCIVSDVVGRRISVRVRVESAEAKPRPLTVRVSAHGSQGSAAVQMRPGSTAEAIVQLELPDAPLWSPEHPNLITGSIELLADGKVIDRSAERFGFRTVSTRGNRLLLNGDPIYLRGYGDDDVEVLTGFPPASREAFRKRLLLAKSFGFNAVRFHSMVPPSEFFEAADEVGILVMAELPAAYTQYFFAHRDYLRNELQNVLLAYRNHPSLLSLAFGNEFNLHWLNTDEERRILVEAIGEFYALAKSLAPSTLIMSNDGFDLRPTEMVSLGEGASPDRPTVRHEFGAYYCSLPDIGLIDKFTGVLNPDWLVAKRKWVERNGLTDIYGEYLRNSQRLQRLGHKYQIERIRANNAVTGYDYWLIVDYPGGTGEGDSWEEGWFDYFWHPKAATPEQGREVNSPVLIMISAGVDDRTMWTDEPKRVRVSVSNYGPGPIHGARLTWLLVAGNHQVRGGELHDIPAPLAEVSDVGDIVLDAATVRAAARLELVLTLETEQGTYGNRWNFWAYPRLAQTQTPPAVGVVSNLRWAGLRGTYPWIHSDTRDLKTSDLLITDTLDTTASAHLRSGGRVWLLLRESPQRRGTSYFPASGGAIGIVLRNHPSLAGFLHEGVCDEQFYNLVHGAYPLPIDGWPTSLTPVIGGLRTTSEFLSKTKDLSRVAYALEANVDSGKLLITTLRLREHFDEAFPEAMTAVDGFLRYAAGPEFKPSGELSEEDLRRLAAN